MTRTEKAEIVFSETKTAIELILGELNEGQRKKVLRSTEVQELCEMYEVDI